MPQDFTDLYELPNRAEMSLLNYLTARREMAVGMPGLFPRMEVPQPVIHSGHTFHNVNVDRSVIDTINTGVIQNLVYLPETQKGRSPR